MYLEAESNPHFVWEGFACIDSFHFYKTPATSSRRSLIWFTNFKPKTKAVIPKADRMIRFEVILFPLGCTYVIGGRGETFRSKVYLIKGDISAHDLSDHSASVGIDTSHPISRPVWVITSPNNFASAR